MSEAPTEPAPPEDVTEVVKTEETVTDVVVPTAVQPTEVAVTEAPTEPAPPEAVAARVPTYEDPAGEYVITHGTLHLGAQRFARPGDVVTLSAQDARHVLDRKMGKPTGR